MNPSIICLPVPQGSLATRTSPAAVLLSASAYSAGCVMLYGSVGLTLRAKFTMPAAPFTTPPAMWVWITWYSASPSMACSEYRGFSGAESRAAVTALRAMSAAVLRCLRASASSDWASSIRPVPGSLKVPGLGGSEEGSRWSEGLAL